MRTSYSYLVGFAALAVFATTAAHAQTSFSIGPRLGLNYSNIKISQDRLSVTGDSRPGLQVGLQSNIGLGNFAVQPAVLFSQLGFKVDQVDESTSFGGTYRDETKADYRFTYLQVPVNVAYSFGAGGQGLQVFAGPYVGFGMNGRASQQDKTSFNGSVVHDDKQEGDVKFDGKPNNDDNFHLKRFDFGLGGGVGYRLNGLLVQLSYAQGLSNILPADEGLLGSGPNDKVDMHNRSFNLSLSYLFGESAK